MQPENEEEYLQKVREAKEAKKTEESRKAIRRVEEWVLGFRLIVYFFDRLARRLFIEKLRGSFSPEKTHTYNQTIFGCLLLSDKITRHILREIRFPQRLPEADTEMFRRSE